MKINSYLALFSLWKKLQNLRFYFLDKSCLKSSTKYDTDLILGLHATLNKCDEIIRVESWVIIAIYNAILDSLLLTCFGALWILDVKVLLLLLLLFIVSKTESKNRISCTQFF